ncbi:MAG: uroporphyrinogen decarboxylase [Flavobacteriales bacterium]|nr:uroporphyrinogen decarboxylase [Flavobacteriales bacterium]
MMPNTKQPPNPTLKNDLLLRAARGEEVERPPVWLMRQAGRILPEYRAVRAAMGGFKDLVETPARASEVTIQPVDLLGVDAAIIFSDILVVPEAMGLPYELVEKVGPRFPEVLRNATDLDRLRKDVDPQVHLNYVLEAIRITKSDLKNRVPLIGFCGAPWTIFCYMVEGKGSKDWALPRRMLWEQPAFAHALLDAITDTSIAYLKAQVDAGVDLVQIFDSWAGVLSAELYEAFMMPHLRKICDALSPLVPVTMFAKGGGHLLPQLAGLSCQTLGLDWQTDPRKARSIVGEEKSLQGNLDPSILYAAPEVIRKKTLAMLSDFGGRRHIANLGHGVYPDVDPEHVKVFVETIKESA